MNAIQLHANDLILFAHIVAAGSFTKAADQTGLPKATLSRRLSELEHALGERLLQRSTRRLALTEFGQHMLEHAQRLLDETEAATALAQHRQLVPQGTLRASFPPEYRELSLVAVVTEFARQYPDVRLELDLSARRVDLVAERFDLAVRAATQLPDDSSLVARHIVTQENGLFASPAYLRRHGTPATPDELSAHVGLALATSGGEHQRWRLSRGKARWEGLPAQAHSANSMGLQLALAAAGLGIVGLSERFARERIEQGALERVLPDWCLPSTTVWCVTPGRRLLPKRTSAFIEILTSMLSDGPARPGRR
ncbi:MAG TPA: LysR family transcriptional regulator [Ottowia sp.]|nr:LysR family transcriptional regulator [Ottowia sp.]